MKTTKSKSRPETLYQLLTFTFDPPLSRPSGVILLQRPYKFSIITDTAEDNCCSSGFVIGARALECLKVLKFDL